MNPLQKTLNYLLGRYLLLFRIRSQGPVALIAEQF